MLFIFLVLIFWSLYVLGLRKRLGKSFYFYKTLVPLIFFSIVMVICLGFNYLAAAIPTLNDGIAIHNFISSLILPKENWSLDIFKTYFNISVYFTLFLIAVFSSLTFLENSIRNK